MPRSAAATDADDEDNELRREAFGVHVQPHIPLLFRTARTLTRNAVDAEDLVQDTLLRAYRAIDRFDGAYPRAWLMTILRNTHINRVQKKRPTLHDDPDRAEADLSDEVTPEDIVVDPMFDHAVATALSELSPSFRQIVELVDLDGLSYAEAASLLDVPIGTVMSRLHRARRKIRDRLGRDDVEHDRRPS